MKYTFEDLQKMNRPTVKGKTFIFDDSTSGWEFVSLAGKENLEELRFDTPQDKLKYLDASRCSIKKISFAAGCKYLQSLYLHHNKLSQLDIIVELPELELVDLSYNEKLNELNFAYPVPKLNYFYLYQCNIKSLEQFTRYFIQPDFDFNIDENGNIQSPPVAIVEKGKEAVVTYFRDLEQKGKDYIYEAKLLILGEPGAGKTSLVRKILDPNAELPKEEETTRGIDVDKWNFVTNIHNEGEKEITLNIWDFGGQAIYKATHRFFLTHRSFYVLLADARKEDTDFFYWLHTVELFGEDSPVMIVVNEKENRKRDLPYQKLSGRFQILKDKKEVNLKNPDNRFYDMMDKLKFELGHLKHIGDPIPSNWTKIRDDLAEAEKNDNIISLQTFRNICKKRNLNSYADQDIVCELFHDLGVLLHFKDDDVLNRSVFLNKEWILDSAYKIIDDTVLEEKKGKITREDIDGIFSDDYKDYIIDILALMKKFYLIYEKDGYIIAPQKLPYDAPEYGWNNSENIQFQFVYEVFMPAGILWQFIVEMNSEIKDELVWRYGIVLTFGDTQAEVVEIAEKNKVRIKVFGKQKEDIRAIIIRKFEEIHRQFKKLTTLKLVPCTCNKCKISDNPFLFNYTIIIDAKNAVPKVTHLQCQYSFANVAITELLYGIEFLEKVKSQKEITQKIKKIRIFLASSNELVEDRREFENFISRQNKDLINENIFLELEIWEHFIDAMSKTRLQDEYNNAVRNSDIFVMLFWTKVGKFTNEEFEKAFGQFKGKDKPLVYTYFKTEAISPVSINRTDTLSLLDFQDKLKALGHFQTLYKNQEDLKYQFSEQLKKILVKM